MHSSRSIPISPSDPAADENAVKGKMEMKKIIFAIAFGVAMCGARAEISGDEITVLALKDVVAEAQASLAASAAVPAGKPVAILPFGGNGADQVVSLLKNALTAAGKTCVEGKEDKMWEEILKEISWDERKEDILDAATLDRFGRLKSAQYLLYGCVRRHTGGDRYVLLELELHASCVATKQHVWGGTFVRRHYAPGQEPEGQVDIPTDVRVALVDGVRAKVAESLGKSAKLGSVRKTVILPIAGDKDQYVEGLFRDVLTTSSVTPVNLDVLTRAEARFALRESAGKADAIAYGALRDLGARLVETGVGGKKVYSALLEVQLWIEKGATREILWSDTVQFAKEFTLEPRGWFDKLCHFAPFLREHPSAIVWIPLGILIGLIVLFRIISAATRVR